MHEKDRNKVEEHFTQQQSKHPKVNNKTPKYGVAAQTQDDQKNDNGSDSDLFSKRINQQDSLDEL
ncbi:hypothetical protein [Tuberibacillus sp. Marseille-P3662]|uniref:hypothetical protein n=1 Tax=Tuberibacillus sp. Marseille-P3662 TaxID=1965358 RepID=UPI00111C7E4C|nr:hypothetical protein [Tuberibacillus sp. Marseille-P3662]